MPTLDQLMSLPGAYGALEFSCTGDLGETRGDLHRDFAEVVAQMCAANMAIYRMQATCWAKHSGQQGFLPERGFAFLGLDDVMVGTSSKAVLAKRQAFDYDRAYKLFNEEI